MAGLQFNKIGFVQKRLFVLSSPYFKLENSLTYSDASSPSGECSLDKGNLKWVKKIITNEDCTTLKFVPESRKMEESIVIKRERKTDRQEVGSFLRLIHTHRSSVQIPQ